MDAFGSAAIRQSLATPPFPSTTNSISDHERGIVTTTQHFIRYIASSLLVMSAAHAEEGVVSSTASAAPAVQSGGASAATVAGDKPPAVSPKYFPLETTCHAQSTMISEKHTTFASPYAGANSLPSEEGRKTSVTATIFAGVQLWHGTEVYVDPELAGGEGFAGVAGIAGFPNGEIPRVGASEPEPYFARLFLRQTINFGPCTQVLEDGPNQVATTVSPERLQLTVGKVAATDFFDGNTYSHDPRSQFMNWSLMDNGAWDYPADTRGYTRGAIAEWYDHSWAVRLGFLEEPTNANGPDLESHPSHALSYDFELEKHYHVHRRDGALRVLVYENRANMGNYQQAISQSATGGTPDIVATRTSSNKFGFGLSAEQAINDSLGVFCRLGWNDGHTESWAFTEIDRTVSLGLLAKGTWWHRPDDQLGLAGVANGLSRDHREYLSDGGYGFIIGDGRLNYGYEKIVECYYLIGVTSNIMVTPEVQYIANPAYNKDRGPVKLWGLRVHLEF